MHFAEPLIPLLRTSGDVFPACNRFVRFTSGLTPTDLLVASVVAEHSHSMY